VSHTAYQYPFALALADCLQHGGKEWTASLLKAIGELSNVAGGHARAYYEMAPRSVVARLTPQLVAGFDTYGFDEGGGFPELARLHAGDLPGSEFWIGGEIVRSLSKEQRERLAGEKAHLNDNPQVLLHELAAAALKDG
jgi:CRISPR-associated protein Cst2